MHFAKMTIILILFLKVWIANKNAYAKRMSVYVFILRFIIGNSTLTLFRSNEKKLLANKCLFQKLYFLYYHHFPSSTFLILSDEL